MTMEVEMTDYRPGCFFSLLCVGFFMFVTIMGIALALGLL